MTFTNAFIYELEKLEGEDLAYMYHNCNQLPYHLRNLLTKMDYVQLVQKGYSIGKMCIYLGYDSDTHVFLEGEGSRICTLYEKDICRFYCVKNENGGHICI